jgi:hypothetical protein
MSTSLVGRANIEEPSAKLWRVKRWAWHAATAGTVLRKLGAGGRGGATSLPSVDAIEPEMMIGCQIEHPPVLKMLLQVGGAN